MRSRVPDLSDEPRKLVLDIRVPVIGLRLRSVGIPRVEREERAEHRFERIAWKAAVEGDDRRDGVGRVRDVHMIRRICRQTARGADRRVVAVEDAGTAAQHSAVAEPPGKSQARRDVVRIEPHERRR